MQIRFFDSQNRLTVSLIKSISGIRGTIGGSPDENLTPIDIVEFISAYGKVIRASTDAERPLVLVGRDGRISGPMVSNLAINTLIGLGIDVYDCGLSTTPSLEVNIPRFGADGGIMITASHNPKQWNALKFMNRAGEFISAEQGQQMLNTIADADFDYADVDHLGSVKEIKDTITYHVEELLADEIFDVDRIRESRFKVVVDGINSTGVLAAHELLNKLDCEYTILHDDMNGEFAHDPEPLVKNLSEVLSTVQTKGADIGFVVDPDVDRLAVIDDNGVFIGEENTIVVLADYLLPESDNRTTVSNLSSSRGLRVITEKYGGTYYASAVGEVNVVTKMKEVNAYFGGEGNGGVIFPRFHYGRDGVLGMALFLQMLADRQEKLSSIWRSMPIYASIKEKIQVDPNDDVDALLTKIADAYKDEEVSTIDGVKVDFPDYWIHIRKSNTEPIIRLYIEAADESQAEKVLQETKDMIKNLA